MKAPTDQEVQRLARKLEISVEAARLIIASAQISGEFRPDGLIVTV